MLDLQSFIMNNITVEPPKDYADKRVAQGLPTYMTFYELCRQKNVTDSRVEKMAARACKEYGDEFCLVEAEPKCVTSAKPIDFIYERKDDIYNLDRYKTREDLIAKVQSGKGDEQFIHYGYNNIIV